MDQALLSNYKRDAWKKQIIKYGQITMLITFSILALYAIKTNLDIFDSSSWNVKQNIGESSVGQSKEVFERVFPHVNIGTIGHVGHGKTTLTAAISKVTANEYGGQAIDIWSLDNEVEEQERGLTISPSYIDYETSIRHYAHIDVPGHPDFVGNAIRGMSQMDAAILVVAANEGIMPQTKEHVLAARQMGVSHIVVFINRVDMFGDEGELEHLEMEVRDMLSAYDFAGDDCPVIFGSALGAFNGEHHWVKAIMSLIDSFDSYIPEPERAIDEDFLMPIAEKFSIPGQGTVVMGRIETGVVHTGDEVNIIGLSESQTSVCTGLEIFHELIDEGRAGELVSVLLRDTNIDDVKRGMVLSQLWSSFEQHTTFEAEIYVLSKSEGGRHTPFFTGFSPVFYIRGAQITGTIELINGYEIANPGDNVSIKVVLEKSAVMRQGLRFLIRDGTTIGSGVIEKSY